MAAADLYGLLGVARDASEADIRRAFRKLALSLHPDKCNGDPEKIAMFGDVQRAHEVLVDPERRSFYDRTGSTELPQAQQYAAETRDFSEVLGQLFGGGVAKPTKRVDTVVVPVSLATVHKGRAKHTVSFSTSERCEDCRGVGTLDEREGCMSCISCAGSGVRSVQVGPFLVAQSQCAACAGIGRCIKPGHACRACGGKKVVVGRRSLDLKLPPGIPDGFVHTSRGKGSFSPETGENADLNLVFKYERMDCLVVREDEVVYSLDISLVEMLCGFEKVISPWSVPIAVSSPAYVHPEREVRLRGLGLSRLNGPPRDLVIRFAVKYPEAQEFIGFSPALRDLFGASKAEDASKVKADSDAACRL